MAVAAGSGLNADPVAAVAALEAAGRFGIVPGLERTRWLLDQFDGPESRLSGVLVAGTNGKGSVAACVEAMCRAAGRRTALLVKPHLVRWTERIVLDGQPITDAVFTELAAEVLTAAAAAPEAQEPTQFEMLTVMGILAAERHGAEVVVCEVGMGGAKDSTNVLDLGGCVITNVALDHREWLGDTIADIAREKAGILKPGDWAVTTASEPARAIIRRRAREVGASLEELERDHDWQGQTLAGDGVRLDVRLEAESWVRCRSPLCGAFQLDNVAAAVRAAHHLGIADSAIAAGAAGVSWPGRLQWIEGSPALLLDGAHNPAAMATLAAAAPELCGDRPVVGLFAAMADKQLDEMLAQLPAITGQVIFTAVEHPRAARPSDLARRHGGGSPIDQPAAALAEARRRATPAGVVLVCGSLALVGVVLATLEAS